MSSLDKSVLTSLLTWRPASNPEPQSAFANLTAEALDVLVVRIRDDEQT